MIQGLPSKDARSSYTVRESSTPGLFVERHTLIQSTYLEPRPRTQGLRQHTSVFS